jgi:hypothetical protein
MRLPKFGRTLFDYDEPQHLGILPSHFACVRPNGHDFVAQQDAAPAMCLPAPAGLT